MTTYEQSGVSRAPAPATLGEALENIDALNFSQGICSPRVQGIIFNIHTPEDKTLKSIQVGNVMTGNSQTSQAFQVGHQIGKWRLFAAETGEPGEVQQTLYFAKANLKGAWEAVPIFTFLEKANDEDCSVALCLPAADATDLDWGVVCTKQDEARPVTIDEQLKDVPQTNAEVLDELTGIITREKLGILQNLASILHIEELHERAFPKELITQEFAQPSTETQSALLARHLKALGEWSVLAATITSTETDISSDTSRQSLRFSPINPGQTSVERIVSGLGTQKRISLLGHIQHAEAAEEPLFQPDPKVEPYFTESTAEEILQNAVEAYEVPEIINDPELTEAINAVIAYIIANTPEADHATVFNQRIMGVINKWDKAHEGAAVLSLGNIDISKLSGGEYFNFNRSNLGPLSAHIQANKAQSVFAREDDYSTLAIELFNCSISGARTAFRRVQGRNLYAENCERAFVESGVSRSIARNVGRAFVGIINRHSNITVNDNCIAQNCSQAFDNVAVEDSIAVYCDSAFTRLTPGVCRNLTAELCGRAFTSMNGAFYEKILRQERNFIAVNSTRRSPRNAYNAAKRFGPKPGR